MSSRAIGRMLHAGTERWPRPRRPRSAPERLQALREAAGVRLLGLREGLEPLCDLVEAFLARRLREARIHLGELVRLAGDRRLQVLLRRPDRLAPRRVPPLL